MIRLNRDVDRAFFTLIDFFPAICLPTEEILGIIARYQNQKKLSMYSRFIIILQLLQLLGYIGALYVASIDATLVQPLSFLLYAIFLCLANYITTQTIIAVIDLLNRIEINTRNSRQN